MDKKDHTGIRGEHVALVRLAEVTQPDDTPIFLPLFLGDKSPLFDILVLLPGAGEATPYFFVQVRSTRKGYTAQGRLRVSIKKSVVLRMVNHPAPVYVIGVDERLEQAYIVSVHWTMKKTITSLSTLHPLNITTLKQLWDEVHDFWQSRDMTRKTSRFTN